MNIDFYQQYKNFSNTELLIIVKRPTNYQALAVAAAAQLLSERQVTDEEIQVVEQHFQDIAKSAKANREKMDALKGMATDFLEPVLHPTEKVEPRKWVNILLLAISIQYAWSLFYTGKHLIRFLRCDNCVFDIAYFAELLTLIYIPIIFFLLFKRRRWGWILLFADNLFSLISRVSQSYIFFKYQRIHHGSTTAFLMPIFIKASFVFFLWRDPIANHFGITQRTKKKTAVITIAGTLVFFLGMYVIYSL
jgi:hypothetical protein